jgi:nucleoside-diphosphate-sugar epimerase
VTTLIVGCGYLGRRVGNILVERRERVFGTVRSPERARELSALGVIPIVADVLLPQTLVDWPEAERILYCVGYDRSGPASMRSVYVDGLRNVLSGLSGRCSRLVYISSTSVYGQNDGGWVDEETPPQPASESGRVCLDAESLVRDFGSQTGRSVTVLRLSGLYGPGRIPRQTGLCRGEPVRGDADKYLNLIHVDDAANAAAHALDRVNAGQMYVVSDERPVTRREFYTTAARMLVAPAVRFEPLDEGPDEPNKRVSSHRMREELNVLLAYPDIVTGLPAAIGRA